MTLAVIGMLTGSSVIGGAVDPNVILESSRRILQGTNSRTSLATRYNASRELDYVASGVTRLDYLDGVLQGYYFGSLNTNQFAISEPLTTDLDAVATFTDVAIDWLGKLTKGLTIPDGTATANATKNVAGAAGAIAQGIHIQMVDGGVPVIGGATSGNDFRATINGNAITVGAIKLVDSVNNIYRVEVTGANTTSTLAFGIEKVAGHSTRGFTLSDWKLNEGAQVLPSVPTNGASAFQGADEHGLAFPSNIDQSGWGADIKGVLTNTDNAKFVSLYSASDGTTNNKVEIFRTVTNTLRLNVKIAGVAVNTDTVETFLTGDAFNVAFSIENGSLLMSVNSALTVVGVGNVPLVLTLHSVGVSSWITGRESDAHYTYAKTVEGTRTAAQLETASAL